MKFKNSNIESKTHFLDFNDSSFHYFTIYPKPNGYYPEIDAYYKTYSQLILEWSKGLYMPFSFLQDIIKRLNDFTAKHIDLMKRRNTNGS